MALKNEKIKHIAVLVCEKSGQMCNDRQFLHPAFENLNDLPIPVFNHPDTVKWNLNKLYLSELNDKGVNTIDTLWMPWAEFLTRIYGELI